MRFQDTKVQKSIIAAGAEAAERGRTEAYREAASIAAATTSTRGSAADD